MKRLILGQIPDDFNPETDIAISPACFVGKEYVYPDFDKLDYFRSYESTEELVYLDKLTNNEALYQVSLVAEKYNPDNFNKFSFRFWKTIYFPFLAMLIPWIFRKQRLIDKIIKKYAEESLEVTLIKNEINVGFKDIFQFIFEGIWNPNINEWVFAKILENQLPDKWNVIEKQIGNFNDFTSFKRQSLKSKSKEILYKQFKNIFYRSIGVYGFSKWDEIYFHFLLSVKPKIENKKIFLDHKFPKQINWNFNIETLINKFLPQTLKNIELEKSIEKKKNNYGKITNFSNKLFYDFDSKLRAAFYYENHNIVLTTQHGGHNYGSAVTCDFIKNIDFKSDYFISWGNYNVEHRLLSNIIPLPSPLLSKYLNIHSTRNNKLILVGTDLIIFQSRFDSVATDEISMLNYRRNKIIFLEKLKYYDTWYRPYFKKQTSLLDWDYVVTKLPNVNRLYGDLHIEITKCRLLILDHPGTTWNIAMAMNTPTICFWERNHFPFNKEADEFLDRFKSLGLYFESPDKAAEMANKIMNNYSNLIEWWNKREIQKLRIDWMNKYALADKNWFWIWTKTLWYLGK